jgi:S1-C subfamily serine protease
MAERKWFVRDRGRVIGPFDQRQLKSLRDRGRFHRFHEISEDRSDWRSASSMVELFPPDAAGGQAYEPISPVEILPASDAPASAAWYYIGPNEKVVGPVPKDRLLSLQRDGTISSSTHVWQEGMSDWIALSNLHPEAVPPIRKRRRRARKTWPLAITALVMSLLIGGILFLSYMILRPKQAIPNILGRDDDLSEALGLVVCGLKATLADGTQVEEPLGIGSCFAVSSDGHLLTNKHVVEQVWKLTHADLLLDKIRKEQLLVLRPTIWIFLNKKKYVADFVHVSENYDLCVLKIEHSGPFFKLAANRDIGRGRLVSACGFPTVAMEQPLSQDEVFEDIRRKKLTTNRVEDKFKPRDFDFVMTNGAVSRVVTEQTGETWVQHNATVNPGNSGGPLILEDGTVIAINTLGSKAGIFSALATPQLRDEIDHVVPKVVWK